MAKLAPLKSLDRLSFHLYYLLRHCSPILSARRPDAGFYDPRHLGQNETAFGNDIRSQSAGRFEKLDEQGHCWLGFLHDRAIDWLYSPEEKALSGWLRFVWNRFREQEKNVPALLAPSLFGLQFVHRVLVLQLAEWNGKDTAKASALQLLDQQVGRLKEMPFTSGDVLTIRLALWTLPWLTATLRAGEPVEEVPTLASEFENYGREAQGRLLQLIGKDDLAGEVEPSLVKMAHKRRLAPHAVPLELGQKIATTLSELREVGGELTAGSARSLGPIEIGAVVREGVARIGFQHWPAGDAAAATAFRKELVDLLDPWEERRYSHSVIPHPRLHDRFLDWVSRQAILTRAPRLVPGPSLTPALIACLNILALHSKATAGDAARKGLDRAAGMVGRVTPTPGDSLMIWLALEGLRRFLSPGESPALWPEVLRKLPENEQTQIRNLASHSPFARLASPELGKDLHEKKIAWKHLAEFLEDPAGEPLRSFAIDRILLEVLPHPERVTRLLEEVLRAVMDASPLGGALFVAEFFHTVARHIFGYCHAHACHVPGQLASHDQQHTDRALNLFRHWFIDHDSEHIEGTYGLLAGLIGRLVHLKRPSEGLLDERWRRLDSHWQAFIRWTARGLRGRAWVGPGQRLLWMYWLNVCLYVGRELKMLPDGLRTGAAGFDDLEPVACRMACQLYAALYAQQQWKKRQQELAALTGVKESADAFSETERTSADFAAIQRQLGQTLKEGPVRDALVVRRLVQKGQKGWQFDNERVLEYVNDQK